jgi:hypothetical protein
MPTLDGVLETALYVDDIGRALGFYMDVLGLQLIQGRADVRVCDRRS